MFVIFLMATFQSKTCHGVEHDRANLGIIRRGDRITFYPNSPIPSTSVASSPGQHLVNGVGWFIDPTLGTNSNTKPAASTLTYITYITFKDATLQLRKERGALNTPEMETLYRFLSHFLRTQINDSLYHEFKELVLEDLEEGDSTGLTYLLRLLEAKLLKSDVSEETLQDLVKFMNMRQDRIDDGKHTLHTIMSNSMIPVENKQRFNDLYGIAS